MSSPGTEAVAVSSADLDDIALTMTEEAVDSARSAEAGAVQTDGKIKEPQVDESVSAEATSVAAAKGELAGQKKESLGDVDVDVDSDAQLLQDTAPDDTRAGGDGKANGEHTRGHQRAPSNVALNQRRNQLRQRIDSKQPGAKSRRNTLKRMKNPSKHKKIDKAHPEFELTYDMMLGIRTFVGRQTHTQATAEGMISKSDFKEFNKHRFPGQGTNVTPPHHMRDFKFKDYCPKVFKALREMFNINPADYLLTLAGNFNYLEFISNSKSGSFFFYTHDRKFLIKTITKEEGQFLKKILPAYYEHIKKYPNTLLNRYYGMHRVKPHKKKQIRFLVMASVFHTNLLIHRVFDLKGSLVGRNATAKEKKAQVPVLKDNDFLSMQMRLQLTPDDAREFKSQISHEADFLAGLNIMDYSLLVGVHEKKLARTSQATPFSRTSYPNTHPDTPSTAQHFFPPSQTNSQNTLDVPRVEQTPSARHLQASASGEGVASEGRPIAATPITGHPIAHSQDQAEREASTNAATQDLDAELKQMELERAKRHSTVSDGNLAVPNNPTTTASTTGYLNTVSLTPGEAHKNLLTDKRRKKEEKLLAKSRRKELPVAAPKKYNLASTPHLSSPEFDHYNTAQLRLTVVAGEEKKKSVPAASRLTLVTEQAEQSLFCRSNGGLPSADGQQVYFMGVIDILQTYRARKKLENFFKGAYMDKKMISCVPPKQYAARFTAFMTDAVDEE